jgi:hypothetical protein
VQYALGLGLTQLGFLGIKLTHEPGLESCYPTRFIQVKVGYSVMNDEEIGVGPKSREGHRLSV